jgi:hypothetical protein
MCRNATIPSQVGYLGRQSPSQLTEMSSPDSGTLQNSQEVGGKDKGVVSKGNLRITRLPKNLTRKDAWCGIRSILREQGLLTNIRSMKIVRSKVGELGVRLFSTDNLVKRALKFWVQMNRARIRWEPSKWRKSNHHPKSWTPHSRLPF